MGAFEWTGKPFWISFVEVVVGGVAWLPLSARGRGGGDLTPPSGHAGVTKVKCCYIVGILVEHLTKHVFPQLEPVWYE